MAIFGMNSRPSVVITDWVADLNVVYPKIANLSSEDSNINQGWSRCCSLGAIFMKYIVKQGPLSLFYI